jgi:hypothetical protein
MQSRLLLERRQHVRVLGAKQEFELPVLIGYQARRAATAIWEGRKFGGAIVVSISQAWPIAPRRGAYDPRPLTFEVTAP